MELLSVQPEPDEATARHQALLEHLKASGRLVSPHVEAAFQSVPRHIFLPGVPLEEAYRDWSVSIKQQDGISISSSSQPTMMAIMLEQLELHPGQRVLEIGAGSGYNAALLAHIVGESGHVVTIDIDDDIVENARAHVAVAGIDGVTVVRADGAFGFADSAPYDRILLTVAAPDILPAWRDQLKPGGRLVLPLDIRGFQESMAFEHHGPYLECLSHYTCGFMTLRGALTGPEAAVELTLEPGLQLNISDRHGLDAQATLHQLTDAHQDQPSDILLTIEEINDSVRLWLAAHDAGFCHLIAHGEALQRDIVPYLYGVRDQYCYTMGIVDKGAVAVLSRPPDHQPSSDPAGDTTSELFALFVRGFGSDNACLHRLIALITAWDTTRRSGSEGIRIRAYPKVATFLPHEHDAVIEKHETWLTFDWM